MKCTVAILLLFLFAISQSFAQIEYPGRPVGRIKQGIVGVPYITLQSAETLSQLAEENTAGDQVSFKVDKFGETIALNIDTRTNGRWLKVDEGLFVWQLGFTAFHASSLGIIFSSLKLEPGSKLFVYSPDKSSVKGAFTFRNNKTSKVFAVSPVGGDSAVVELQVSGNPENYGELVIGKIGIGFPADQPESSPKDGWYGWSDECETDINCVFDSDIQRQKYAVCRVIYNNTNRCTGTLINNTAQDGTPLVLTGGHCIRNSSDAETAIFAFDYESPYCEGPDGKVKSISGSTLLARSPNLDFALVQLSEAPPADYYPVYAGWDASGKASNYTYVAHHPEGDVKKISIDYDSLWTGSFLDYDPFTHWLIPAYEIGTTERGSSGGALFDTANRIIGTLSGGGTVCSDFIFDYYQNFSHCWADYPDADKQLKIWLDPLQTGSLVSDNYMPVDPAMAYSEKLSNIASDEQVDRPDCPDADGWITGQNAAGTSDYLEQFNVRGSKYIYAVWLDPARIYFTDSYARFSLKIWEGTSTAEELVFQKDIYLFELMPDTLNFIRLDTMVLVNGNFFVGYEVFYREPADTFAVKMVVDASGREINSAFKMKDSKEDTPYAAPALERLTCVNQALNTSLAIYPVVFNYYIPDGADPENLPLHEVTLYPNPAYDYVQILFKKQPEGAVTVKVYDLNGRNLDIWGAGYTEPNIRLDTRSLIRGMYVLRIDYSEGTVFRKLLIL